MRRKSNNRCWNIRKKDMVINKKSLILCIVFAYAFIMSAYANKPSWIYQLPSSTNSTYEYKITQAEAKTYDEAYSKALARAILETSWRLSGVTVKVNDDLGGIEQNVDQSLHTIAKEVRLYINKVDEYVDRPAGSMKVRLYILWQVPVDGNIKPSFEPLNNP